MLVHFPLSLTLLFINWDPKPGATNKPTIILVERWIKRNPLHIFMKRYFEKHGYTVHSINFPMLSGSFPESAQQLHDYITSHALNDVILIGLSNGGLTCYEYLENYDGWQKAGLLITVGSPFGGAIRAHLLYGTQVKQDIDPHGTYIKKIRAISSRHLDQIYCIGAKVDQMVGNEQSYLPGAHRINIDVIGHNLLHTIWRPTYEMIHKCMLH